MAGSLHHLRRLVSSVAKNGRPEVNDRKRQTGRSPPRRLGIEALEERARLSITLSTDHLRADHRLVRRGQRRLRHPCGRSGHQHRLHYGHAGPVRHDHRRRHIVQRDDHLRQQRQLAEFHLCQSTKHYTIGRRALQRHRQQRVFRLSVDTLSPMPSKFHSDGILYPADNVLGNYSTSRQRSPRTVSQLSGVAANRQLRHLHARVSARAYNSGTSPNSAGTATTCNASTAEANSHAPGSVVALGGAVLTTPPRTTTTCVRT